ncbi:unnamed protein product [Clonostachys byssicola]|uniref:Uncharacterized protein n=1 Tax=Clonostachys byssicola TaxID=160290 RepID=A0A9N9U775_9HYPO|nr:unnamed protein product [Clonostachys byssicola]
MQMKLTGSCSARPPFGSCANYQRRGPIYEALGKKNKLRRKKQVIPTKMRLKRNAVMGGSSLISLIEHMSSNAAVGGTNEQNQIR